MNYRCRPALSPINATKSPHWRPVATLALLLPMALLTGRPASAQAPFSFDSAYGRLPKDVVPLDYVIAIKPDLKTGSLTGSEIITLNVRSATSKIQFNSLNEVLKDVMLDGQKVAKVESDDTQQLTTLTLATPLKPGRHKLSFAYSGKIETTPQGLFAQHYAKPDGSKDVLLSTQFEQTDARRMFPCWDEPAFRATFQLTATVPAKWATISNMPIARQSRQGEMQTVSFRRSPSMPSYLVEFSAGDLAAISASKDGENFSIWAVRGQEQNGAVALANAQQILADYNDYFGVPYPLPKLDSIAVPGGFQGAMENWGAITYNDQTLLLTPSSTIGNRQTVFSIQAHEMAHQWNGDLVTMGWWDDIWLNESFASWRAARETDLRNPSWNWLELQDGSKESAMDADARLTSHAIQQHVTDELQAANAFDPQITYAKGEAVLNMLEAYLGEDKFRDGIRAFMRARQFSNATSADLWNALSGVSGSDIGKIAADWTTKPGFPLVRVSASCDGAGNRTLTLAQRRFLLQGEDPAHSQWNVPLQIKSGIDGKTETVLLTRDGQQVASGKCDQPITVNAKSVGYFRTAFDDASLQANSREFARLAPRDRIALLDDQWALVATGQQKLPAYLALATALGTDLDERAWNQVSEALGTIEEAERGSAGHDAFAAFARSLVKPAAEKLGWDAKPGDMPGILKLRRNLLTDLGAWGDAETIAEAHKRFARLVADHHAFAADDQAAILATIAHNASAADFEQLHALAKSATNETEQRRYYGALMRVRDPQLAEQAGKIALSDEIPPQADAIRVNLIFSLEDENPSLAWRLFTENNDQLMAPAASFAPLTIAQFAPEIFWNAVPLAEMERWVTAKVPAEMADFIARGMETAHFKLDRKARLTHEADGFIAGLGKHG